MNEKRKIPVGKLCRINANFSGPGPRKFYEAKRNDDGTYSDACVGSRGHFKLSGAEVVVIISTNHSYFSYWNVVLYEDRPYFAEDEILVLCEAEIVEECQP